MAFTFVASNASLLPALRIPSPLPTSFSRRPRHLPFFTFQCQRHRVVTCSAAPAPPPPSPSPTDSPLIQETPCFTRNIMATPMPMHHREVYLSAVADAVRAHLSDYVANPTPQNFAQVTLLPPQLNPELDVFDRRFLLQYVWRILSVTSSFGLRARVLIQGSRRFGATPLSIQGLRRTFDADLDLSRETWPPGAVRSGELELDSDIDDDDDIVLLLSPTNAVSIPVTESLADLVERVAHRPIILLNPRLADIPSHSGVMQVAGRAERISLLEKFHQIFYMRLLFDSGKVYPLRGILYRAYPDQWQVWRALDEANAYRLVLSKQDRPSPSEIGNSISVDRYAEQKRLLADAQSSTAPLDGALSFPAFLAFFAAAALCALYYGLHIDIQSILQPLLTAINP